MYSSNMHLEATSVTKQRVTVLTWNTFNFPVHNLDVPIEATLVCKQPVTVATGETLIARMHSFVMHLGLIPIFKRLTTMITAVTDFHIAFVRSEAMLEHCSKPTNGAAEHTSL